jgi:tryptophan halogenase
MKSKNIKDIVIVGGGTAGWMTASLLIKFYPDKNITLIESEDIGTVGVGESTLGGINWYFNALGLKDKEWMKECNASYKMSIKFTDFYDKDSGSFHYPFGSPELTNTGWELWDWHLVKHQNPEISVEDYVKSYFPASHLFDQNKISENKDGSFDNYNINTDVSYHFDALLFGRWLRKNYAIPRGVNHVVGTVKEIDKNDSGINKVTLENGNEFSADLFIDCTGFKSLLLGETLNEPFISKDNFLVNNRAWAAQVPYKDKEKELEPFTNCTAIENGWCWNIPLWSRLGTGYVYSDKYVDPETAKEEYKKYLMSDKMVIPRTKEEVDSLVFRDIKMRVGIHERLWVKNVLAIGLSAGFIEPLESNGLFSVHEFLFKLLKILSLPKVNQMDKDMFNASCRDIFENFTNFVSLHYALSHRDDTKYWQDIQNRTFSKDLVELNVSKNDGYASFNDVFMNKGEYIDKNGGIHCIATGLNYILVDDFAISAKELIYPDQNYYVLASLLKSKFDFKKEKWQKAAEKEPTLYKYLKKNIYKD